MSNSFRKSMVDVQKRNAFDLSFINSFTANPGTLVPCLCRKVMPGDVISDGISFNVELPPLASQFKGKIDVVFEAFFVPNRLLYGGWQDYMLYNGGLDNQFKPAGVSKVYLPNLLLKPDPVAPQYYGNGTLMDYLGIDGTVFKNSSAGTVPSQAVDLLRFLAYHKIWNDWYRDPMIQKPAFQRSDADSSDVLATDIANIPWVRFLENNSNSFDLNSSLYDGIALGSLRQRNYYPDYFTSAYATINGGSSPVSVQVSTTDSTFTIQQFRAANALQRFAERNQLARGDYKKSIFVNYGVEPSDYMCDRSIYLGRCKKPLTAIPIYSNAGSSSAFEAEQSNIYTLFVGGKAGNATVSDSGSLVQNFKVREHGYFMVLFSLVPHAVYNPVCVREAQLLGTGTTSPESGSFVDNYCVPAFAQVGNQPINQFELSGDNFASSTGYFGYTERYAEYKTSFDELHGLLKDSGSLYFYSFPRKVSSGATIGSDFIEIPVDCLNNIYAYYSSDETSELLGFHGCVVDVYHEFNALRPLPKYSIPTLCDEILDSKWVEVDKIGRL